jgi:hypothetical protein
MDSKRGCEPINESSGSSIREEFFEGPLHSNKGLDGVPWLDLQITIRVQVELKNINDTKVSVLATEFLLNCTIVIDGLIPLVVFDWLSVHQNLTRLSTWVSYSNSCSCSLTLRPESESHILCRGSRKVEIINTSSISLDN